MRLVLTSMLLLSVSFTAEAADFKHAEELHAENCVRCHDSSVYTRENRRVQSLPKLGTQVRMCRDNLGITWFDDETGDVIQYLNKEFYKF